MAWLRGTRCAVGETNIARAAGACAFATLPESGRQSSDSDAIYAPRMRKFAVFIAIGVALLGLLAGCGSTTSPTVSRAGSAAKQTPAAQSVLMQVVVQPSDVPAGVNVGLYNRGDQVGGQVTLDLCGATFPSEALRVARRQVGVFAGQTQFFSTEAVLYRSSAARAQAITEVMHAVATCPKGFEQGNVHGEPALKTSFGPPPDRGWPATAGIDRLALDLTLSDQSGDSVHEIEVFLARGSLLLGLYFQMPAQEPPIAGQTTAEGVAGVFAARILALPAPEIGA